MSNYSNQFSDSGQWLTPPRETRRPTLTSESASSSSRSIGFRLGVSRNYQFGLSDPLLRPAVPDGC
jgi:hypothetical protein